MTDPAESSKPSAKDTAKDIAGNAAAAAAVNAVRGAAVGGVAGAAAGAIKGAAVDLARDRRVRRGIVYVVAAAMAVTLCGVLGSVVTATTLVGTIAGGKEQNASQSVIESGVDDGSTNNARKAGEKYGLPWTLTLAAQLENDDVDLPGLASALENADPNRQYRDLTAGATYQWAQRAMTIPAAGDGRALADQVEQVHLAALQAVEFTEPEAKSVFDQARSWALGEVQCATNTGGGVAVIDGDSFTFNGKTFTAKQVANMKTIIGIAKTMFPTHAKEAAIVGLITAAVESGFQNYANDGVVGPEDGDLSASSRAEYAKLKYSLTLDHDAVGTDHTSVGIMQQQAIFSWGAVGTSTWATDPQGVIKRLMTPRFAAAKFFERMAKVDDWADKEPGKVAQAVQISAFPDRYTDKVELAETIWSAYATSSASLSVPAGIVWDGSADDSEGDDGTVSVACGDGAGNGILASGNEQQLAQQILEATDRGEIIWWGNPAETINQVKRYAKGDPIPEACTLDVRILQIILLANSLFDKMSVNSLNRRCTGSTIGAGKASMHWKGRAVDFGFLGGTSTTGGDPNSIKLIRAIDKVAPKNSGIGQINCRGGRKLTSMIEFDDTCNHQHFNLPRNGNEPLSVDNNTGGN